jgi:pyruvate formate lyase activating enzyme
VKGVVFDIKKFAVHDGPGIRTTIFFKGCPLQCTWCHNPESKKKDPEEIIVTSKRKCLDLSYTETKEVIGREVSVDEIMTEIKKDIVYYDESGGGVTFSGGEPMMQPEFLKTLLTECRKNEINTCVDTSGYAEFDNFENILDLTDSFNYDLKLMNEDLHIRYTGVSNKKIHENLQKISEKGKAIYIRIPIVPGITDTEKNIAETIKFLSSLKSIQEIDLLPYNRLASNKYHKLREPDFHNKTSPPSNERMEELKSRFEAAGFSVKIGG